MNEPINIIGTVYKVDEVKEYGASNFRKHEVVIKTGSEKYPNPIKVEFTKENIEESTKLMVGQEVEIECYLNGTERNKDGNTFFFLNLRGNNINVLNTANTEPF